MPNCHNIQVIHLVYYVQVKRTPEGTVRNQRAGKVTCVINTKNEKSTHPLLDVLIWFIVAEGNHGVGSPDHFQESDISMLYYLSHSHFT